VFFFVFKARQNYESSSEFIEILLKQKETEELYTSYEKPDFNYIKKLLTSNYELLEKSKIIMLNLSNRTESIYRDCLLRLIIIFNFYRARFTCISFILLHHYLCTPSPTIFGHSVIEFLNRWLIRILLSWLALIYILRAHY
jgi:hypothetical protein